MIRALALFAGILFVVLGVCGAFGLSIYLLIYAIWDIIQMFQQEDPVTFGQVAWVVCLFMFRELLAGVVAFVSWMLAFVCFAIAGAD